MRNTYNGYNIELAPTQKFPDMVEISKDDFTKKFVSNERAVLWIEAQKTNELIDKQHIKVQDELYENGLFYFED